MIFNPRRILNALAVLAVIFAGWWLYETGRDHEEAEAEKRTLDALRERERIESEIKEMSDEDLADRLTR